MDIATAKLVLSAYRSDRHDAEDPVFAEALRAAEADPELAAWFADEQRFDALVRTVPGEVPTPPGLKDLILLNAKSAGIAALPAVPPETRSRPVVAARWQMAGGSGVRLAGLRGRSANTARVCPIGG